MNDDIIKLDDDNDDGINDTLLSKDLKKNSTSPQTDRKSLFNRHQYDSTQNTGINLYSEESQDSFANNASNTRYRKGVASPVKGSFSPVRGNHNPSAVHESAPLDETPINSPNRGQPTHSNYSNEESNLIGSIKIINDYIIDSVNQKTPVEDIISEVINDLYGDIDVYNNYLANTKEKSSGGGKSKKKRSRKNRNKNKKTQKPRFTRNKSLKIKHKRTKKNLNHKQLPKKIRLSRSNK